MTNGAAAELGRCPQVLAELTARARTSEKFIKNMYETPRRPPTTPWPPEDYTLMDSDSIPIELVKDVPKAAYWTKKRAAIYIMAAYRTQEIFKIKDINVTRELMATCPILMENLKKPLEIWEWIESTSGLYIEKEGNRPTQLAMARWLLTTLVWKVKEGLREKAITKGTAEPLLDIKHLQEGGVDIAYDPSWSRGQKSYAKEKIDEQSAQLFAKARTAQGLNQETDPYTLAGRCPGCEEGVPPGTLADHLLTCTTTNPAGYSVECTHCTKQFTTMQHLAQHRALHCRNETKLCDACGNVDPCGCRQRRDKLCEGLKKTISEATDKKTGTVFDLTNTAGRLINDSELKTLCYLVEEDAPPAWGLGELEGTLVALGIEERKKPVQKKKPSPCGECGHRSDTQEQHDAHLATHIAKCDLCDFTTGVSMDMSQHVYEYHYPCSRCEYVADSVNSLQDHTMVCNGFLDERSKHTANEEEIRSDTESESDDESVISNKRRKEKNHKTHETTHEQWRHHCSRCDATFPSEDDLITHWDATGHRRGTKLKCDRCEEEFDDSMGLLQHTQANHRSEGENPLWCPCCTKPVKENKYLHHLKRHKELWGWCPGGVPCQHCHMRADTVASALEHLLNFHKPKVATTLVELKRHLEAKVINKHGLEKAAAMAVKRLSGEESDVKCPFEGCGMKFYDTDERTNHQKEHQCTICDYIGRSPRDLSDHQDKHGKTTTGGRKDDNFACEKCGMKLSTLRELAEHKDTHKKYACPKCHARFTSNYLANKHELTCTDALNTDVFEASRTSDPLMVVMNSLGQLVNTFSESGAITDDVTGIMKDQLRKAKHNHSTQETYEKNYQTQRTWTFLKPPSFTPGNVVTSYIDRDITELKGKEFAGDKTPEENYTRLQSLTTTIGRIVKSKLITKDVATELLILYLKAPALNLVTHFRERFEQKHGDAVPEYEDILILLENRYIRIKPEHAREQLNAMTKGDSESLTDFFDRAWRCSHFASFTEEEQDRYKFRNDTVKAAVMRSLGAAKRKIIEDEQLKRKMKGKEPLEPAEIVDLLYKHQTSKESQDSARNRPDYSLVGELTPAYVKRVENDPAGRRGRGRGRAGRLRQIQNAEEPPQEPPRGGHRPFRGRFQRQARARGGPQGRGQVRAIQAATADAKQKAKEERSTWITNAKQKVGEGCFKCGKEGHGSKQCLKYKLITKQICSRCNQGFHAEQACTARGQAQAWRTTNHQYQRGRGNTDRRQWQPQNPSRGWQPRQNQPSTFGRGTRPSRGTRGGRRPSRGFQPSRGGISRIAQDQYRQNLTWKARQVATGNKPTPAIKQEREQGRGNQTQRATGTGRGRGNKGVYNPFLTSGDRIHRVEAQDATDAYMEALNQGS